MFYGGTSLVLVPLLCYNGDTKWSFLKCTQINLHALHGGFVADINVSRKYVIINSQGFYTHLKT